MRRQRRRPEVSRGTHGRRVPSRSVPHETDEVALFVGAAPVDAEVMLDEEHDRYVWATLDEARERCLPAIVTRALLLGDEWVTRAGERRR